MIPKSVAERIQAHHGPIRNSEPVAGGCINSAARIELDSGASFLKWNVRAPVGLFTSEAAGLEQLRTAAATELRIPVVLDAWDDGILLEWLERALPATEFGRQLGGGLAGLHRARADGPQGDNWIGSLPQSNAWAASWAEFWITRRLEPQLRLAQDAGRMPGKGKKWACLFGHIPEFLAPAEQDGFSLLHGDLWSGNVLPTAAGPALVDPAVYHGHREVDLAMAELFRGFDGGFYDAYGEAWPLLPGYAESRRAIYQLYPLLVHVNLFGGAYVPQTARLLESACF